MSQQYQIMVADDDFSMRMLLEETLYAQGYQVLSFDNGESLLQAFTDQRPDLILLDINMPGKSGFEVCRQIRQQYYSLVPVVIMTNLTDLVSIEKSYQVGACDFFTKPINWTILTRRVQYIIRSSQTLMALHQAHQAQGALFNAIPDTILRLSKSGDLLDTHQADKAQAIDFSQYHKLSEFPVSIKQALLTALEKSTIAQQVVDQTVVCPLEQQVIYFDLRCSYSDDNEYIVILRDITQQHEDQARIRYLALYDENTGLPNRRYLEQYLFSCLEKSDRYNDTVGLIFIDIDDFNKFNDIYGIQFGDQLLAAFSERLQISLRNYDFSSVNQEQSNSEQQLTYFSSDEFIVVIERTDAQSMFRIGKRLQQGLLAPFLIEGKKLQLSASMGITLSSGDSTDYLQLIRQADVAKREAKQSDRSQICFYNAYQADKVKRRYEIEQELHHALSNNEFTLLYQPQIQVADQRSHSVETLIRWHNATLGNVPPDEFIAVSEGCGLIHDIGIWVLATACAQLAKWRENNVAVQRVAVNVSAIQLSSHNILANELETLLKKYNLPGSMIEIEITESVFLEDIQRAKKQLLALKALGCLITIDDFGTGYSSLSYLNSFDFDILKIDQSFICQINHNQKAENLIHAIIAIANSLSIKTVAEGVESEEQAEFVRQSGCDFIQGYLYSRPLTCDALGDYFIVDQACETVI